jgi:hypothetical protein
MRLRTACERNESLVVEAKVIRVLTMTGHEPDIFRAPYRLSAAEFHVRPRNSKLSRAMTGSANGET